MRCPFCECEMIEIFENGKHYFACPGTMCNYVVYMEDDDEEVIYPRYEKED